MLSLYPFPSTAIDQNIICEYKTYSGDFTILLSESKENHIISKVI